MNKSISNIKDYSFTLPINLFTFNPCKEWVLFKLKLKGLYVDFQEVCIELSRLGITDDELVANSTAIEKMLNGKSSRNHTIKIIQRYVESKRVNEDPY